MRAAIKKAEDEQQQREVSPTPGQPEAHNIQYWFVNNHAFVVTIARDTRKQARRQNEYILPGLASLGITTAMHSRDHTWLSKITTSPTTIWSDTPKSFNTTGNTSLRWLRSWRGLLQSCVLVYFSLLEIYAHLIHVSRATESAHSVSGMCGKWPLQE